MSRARWMPLVVVTALLATVGASPAVAAPAVAAPGAPSDRALTVALDRITGAGMVGAFAEARHGRHVWRDASGVADVATDRPARPHFRHRVGSVTKSFVAATVLQLVAEGRLHLDAPFGRHLPEYAVDGVTVRMLLNHTSGLGDYDTVLFRDAEDVERNRYRTFSPDTLARTGLAEQPTGAPGSGWSYSNTNYVLAGLLIERVTGRPATEEITRRVIRPLGLTGTYFPDRSTRITGPHSRGYVPWSDGGLRDFSEYDMSWAWTAGALVSTTRDLDTFFRALLGGRLLPAPESREMRTTVPMDPADPAGPRYGLGVYSFPLPSGERAWGHDGQVFGHATMSFHSADGTRQVTVATNLTHYQAPGRPDPIGEATADLILTALAGTPTAPATRHLPRTPAPSSLTTPSPHPALH